MQLKKCRMKSTFYKNGGTNMIFNIEFWNEERYLPTKRHRKLRTRYVKNSVDVEIKEPSEKEFPIAFIIHDYKTVYENAKSYW